MAAPRVTKEDILAKVYFTMFREMTAKNWRRQVINRKRKRISCEDVVKFLTPFVKQRYKEYEEEALSISANDIWTILPAAPEFVLIGKEFCYRGTTQ